MTIRPASWAATMLSGLGKQRSREDAWRGGRGDCETLERKGEEEKKTEKRERVCRVWREGKVVLFLWDRHSLPPKRQGTMASTAYSEPHLVPVLVLTSFLVLANAARLAADTLQVFSSSLILARAAHVASPSPACTLACSERSQSASSTARRSQACSTRHGSRRSSRLATSACS